MAPERAPEASAAAPPPIHGSHRGEVDRARALEADRRAQQILGDQDVGRILAASPARHSAPRARQVFVNRNLRMSSVELIGFDMDYTLAIYHLRRIERLSFDMTLAKLVSSFGYPEDISRVPYDHDFVLRGLVVDKVNGNLLKMDRFGYVGRVFHGRRPLEDPVRRKLYREVRIRVRPPQYAWIDTLFALPEACLYAGIIDLFESTARPVDYAKLYDDIREAIDTVHRDNSLKAELRKDIGHFIFKDPELGPALHKLRSAGKRLFLLTNSLWDYTDAVMSYLLDGVVSEYPTWRNYFDFVVTGARKPDFFTANHPFLEVDIEPHEFAATREASTLERAKVYQGGNLQCFERLTGYSGENILYVGDHIFGDILKSKKTSLWRTCMIVQELEDEITYTDSRHEEISRLSEVERIRARLDDAVSIRKAQLNGIERRIERDNPNGGPRQELEEQRRHAKAELDTVRWALKEATAIADTLERDVEEGFNPNWGLLFKEGNENSRFGYQVEQYACIYTSRVSNLLHYSPAQYFRSPRDLMPHEKAGALTAKLAPVGGEGVPQGED